MDSIIAYYYEAPSTFQETYECVVTQAWANDVARMKTNAADVHPVVPVGHIMAFILCLGIGFLSSKWVAEDEVISSQASVA